MPQKGLKELYIDELKDLYSAENQLVKALPKMAKAATSTKLRQGFEEHLEQTKGHVQRLDCSTCRSLTTACQFRVVKHLPPPRVCRFCS